MSEVFLTAPEAGASRADAERVRALCRKHWLGTDEPADHQAAATLVRQGYFTTASEYYKAATRIYDLLTSPNRPAASQPQAFTQVNRNLQLLLAYATLWEAFRHLYHAASHTHFARYGAEREPLEAERTKMDRVLRPPILPDAEVAKIVLLRNGETPGGAILRLCSRHSREMEKIAGETHDQTITDMDAFLQGVAPASPSASDAQSSERLWEAWVVRALDDAGRPIDPDSPLDAEKYRSAIKWLCYQIHQNITFVGKSDDPIDDAILVIRSFCLLDPIVGILLQESRKDLIFAL